VRDIPKGERGRKTIHYLTIFIPVIYYFWVEKIPAVIILAIVTALMIIAELLRLYVPFFRNFYNRFFGYMTREHEHNNHITGATNILIGLLIAVSLFPKEIAVASMLFLSAGDPTACLIGMSFGRVKIGTKTLEGTLAFITISLLVTWWIPNVPFWVKAIGAVTAGGLELFHGKLDDNLLIPPLSALIMYLLVL
jgi:dolichol kinase